MQFMDYKTADVLYIQYISTAVLFGTLLSDSSIAVFHPKKHAVSRKDSISLVSSSKFVADAKL